MNFVLSLVAAYFIQEQVSELSRASSILADDVSDWVSDVKESVLSRKNRVAAKKPKSDVRLKWERILAEKKKN